MARPQRLKSSLSGASPVDPLATPTPEPAAQTPAAEGQGSGAESDKTAGKKIGRPVGTGRNIDTKTRSVTITLSILEESLNAVAFLKDNPNAPRTFTQLLDQALFEKNAQLREQYNNGEPFPQREGKLRPGPR
ncbi:hypothetical protein ACFYVR_25160 [Rhodococcus sp. NPDC003318]|uniref:hypothetical protein n=1 Tax=Rhodococcus sp. NPDC003318 TaxID=3364503 RepID=UPI003693D9F8